MPGPRPVGGRAIVERDRGRALAPFLDRTHLERRLGQRVEPARRRGHHPRDHRARLGQILLAPLVGVGEFEFGVGPHRVEEAFERALVADARLDALHLAANARDLLQADPVDLVGGQVGGRVLRQPHVIISRAIGQAPRAVIALRLRLDLVERREQGREAAPERARERRLGIGHQRCLRPRASYRAP